MRWNQAGNVLRRVDCDKSFSATGWYMMKTGSGEILRDIDDAERPLAETRAAMESGANHITEICDAA
jgi:hypothetical protein